MSNGLLSIITVRSDSTRLPNKALLPIKSFMPGETRKQTLPLIVWLIRRCRQLNAPLVAATTNEDADNELARVIRAEGIECIRGSKDDVIDRMNLVIMEGQYPGVKTVQRLLGDCPFISTRIVSYAARRLEETGKDAFVYALPGDCFPVYGSREFPYSLAAWQRIVRDSEHREHPDMYFHLNRRKFNTLLHIGPDSIYFRPYRLELDTESDAQLIRVLGEEVGMLAPLRDAIRFLDKNPSVARINSDQMEKTGPLNLSTYSNGKRVEWLMSMQGKEIMAFTGETLNPPDKQATPVFCNCGNLIGWGTTGRLHTKDGSIIDEGFPKCKNCGLFVRQWQKMIPRAEKAA